MDPNQLQQLQQAAFMNQQMFVANPAALQQMNQMQMQGNNNFQQQLQ